MSRPAPRPLSRRTATVIAVVVLLAGLLFASAWWWARATQPVDPGRGVRIRLLVDGARETYQLLREGERLVFVVEDEDPDHRFTPDELAVKLFDQKLQRSWIEELFNISSPVGIAWVGMGLLGQLLFTGRMLVQWLHSERAGRSEVPPIFWWLSLAGAAMLLVYFTWRMDVVGVLGQSLGFVIYFRNIMLLRSETECAKPRAPARGPERDASDVALVGPPAPRRARP